MIFHVFMIFHMFKSSYIKNWSVLKTNQKGQQPIIITIPVLVARGGGWSDKLKSSKDHDGAQGREFIRP